MKNLKCLFIILMISLFGLISLNADTWTEDFDTAANWSQGSGYGDITYTNPLAPSGITFSGTNVYRDYQYVTSGTYSWRTRNETGADFKAEISNTVNSFSVQMAKWGGNLNVDINYSIDGGTTYTLIEAIDGSIFSGDKVFQLYSHTFDTPISPATGSSIIIQFYTVSGERMLYDDFTFDYGTGGTPTVATPVFTPGTGTYFEEFDVTIATATDGATIYYSIDYVDPELTGVLLETYTTPFLIDSDCTIEAWAELTGYTDSQTVSATYTFMEATDNLVVNGGFENWDDATTPIGWTAATTGTGQEDEIVHSGNYSISQIPTGSRLDLKQSVSGIEAGKTYTISFWYFDNAGGRGRIWSNWTGESTISDDSDVLKPDDTYSTNSPDWQEFSIELVAPVGATGFNFEVRSYAGGPVYYDDFSIVEVVDAEPVPLVADFTADNISGTVPLTVSFTDLTIGGGDEYLYEWNFGDSNTSSEANPIHTYDTPGSYTVELYVTYGTDESTEIKENYITVLETLVDPAVGTLYISKVCEANATNNEYIEFYNNSNDIISLDNVKLLMVRADATTEITFNLNNPSYAGDRFILPHSYIVISRSADIVAFETEWNALPEGVSFLQGSSAMYFGASTARRWQVVLDTGAKAEIIIDDTLLPVGGSGNASYQASPGNWVTITDYESVIPGVPYLDQTLPVTLSSFMAVQTSENFAEISWTAESETSLLGYNLFRNEMEDVDTAIRINNTLIESQNISTSHDYSYTDNEVDMNTTYYYWLQINETDGTFSFYGPSQIRIDENNDTPEIVIPTKTTLNNVYPNPFNPTTAVSFYMGQEDNITLNVYNMKGQLVINLATEKFAEGFHNVVWNGKDANGRDCASGIYFFRMETKSDVQTIKGILMK